MIPLRDRNPTLDRPVVTWALIGLNLVVFVGQLLAGHGDDETIVLQYGLIPNVITSSAVLVPNGAGGAMGALVTPFTSMFLHGGFAHILGNMWFLHIFGDNVEDALGKARYVVFYLVSGLAAAAAQVLADPGSAMPMVGASGAISGVLAGYVVLFPRARVTTLVPIVIFVQLFELPAFLFIFVWFGLQLVSGLGSLGVVGGGVAWWAHIGGFLAGLILVKLFASRARLAARERRATERAFVAQAERPRGA